MKKITCLLLCTLAAFSSFTPNAPAELVVEITQGNTEPLPIAIPAGVGQDPQSTKTGQEIADIITNDLKSTGLFEPLPPATFIESIATMGPKPRFPDWRLIKAQALVTNKVTQEGNKLRLEMRLWDVLAEKQIEGLALTGSTADIRRLAHKAANAIYKRLTGDNGYFDTQIVYVAESAPNTKKNVHRLAIMDQDGANHKFLTDGSSLVLTPRFSPKYPEIVYMAYTQKGKNNLFKEGHVHHRNLVTGQTKTIGRTKEMTYAPRFSPDGTKIIFSQTQGGYSSIYTQDLRSGTLSRLTNSPSIDTSPCYSPDGTKVVFNSDRGGKRQLYVMNSDGSNAQRISSGDDIYATPIWSPRGDLIAFTKIAKGRFYIGIMRPDGSGERLITEGFVLDSAAWCPNGRNLLYTRQTPGDKTNKGSTSKIYLIDITGRNNTPLLTPQNASQGAWSPLDYR